MIEIADIQAGDKIMIEGWPVAFRIVEIRAKEVLMENVKSGMIVRAEMGHLTNGKVKYQKV